MDTRKRCTVVVLLPLLSAGVLTVLPGLASAQNQRQITDAGITAAVENESAVGQGPGNLPGAGGEGGR